MRQELIKHVLENQGTGLHTKVSEAIREHQSILV
jgi:hypothetical protein